MKLLFPFSFLILIIISCGNLTKTKTLVNQVNFETDKTSYSRIDSININIENGTDYGLVIGLRCKKYLEVYYQKKELDSWSDNLNFWYMSLGCPTAMDTIEPNGTFKYSMKSEIFDSTGIYRLVLNYYNPFEKTEGTKYSNDFEIR